MSETATTDESQRHEEAFALHAEAMEKLSSHDYQGAERLAGDAMQRMRGMEQEQKRVIKETWMKACNLLRIHQTMRMSPERRQENTQEETATAWQPFSAPVTIPMPKAKKQGKNAAPPPVGRSNGQVVPTAEAATDADDETLDMRQPEPLFSFLLSCGLDTEKAVFKEGKVEKWCEQIEHAKHVEKKLDALESLLKATRKGQVPRGALQFGMRYILAWRIIRLKEIRQHKECMHMLKEFGIEPR